MSRRFVDIDRTTPMLPPPDRRSWVSDDDLVHFVLEAVEALPLSEFHVNDRGTGSAQYPPRMLLGLLIYRYANGVFSSRRIERATYRDIAVRYLTGNTHPDHDTIRAFRRKNFAAVSSAFLAVLKLARELKLLKVGTVSVDGTHLKANASKFTSIRYDRARELEKQLKLEIAELLEKAEAADRSDLEDPQSLPTELAHREKLRAKLAKARDKLEEQARAQAAAEQEAFRKKVEDRDKRPPNRKALYALRKQTVEPVFGIIKEAMGFRQFLLRGSEKVSGEWQLLCLAYNVKRLFALKTG